MRYAWLCEHTDSKHYARGLCRKCYREEWKQEAEEKKSKNNKRKKVTFNYSRLGIKRRKEGT